MDKIIYIILDEEVISNPVVTSKIPDGHLLQATLQ